MYLGQWRTLFRQTLLEDIVLHLKSDRISNNFHLVPFTCAMFNVEICSFCKLVVVLYQDIAQYNPVLIFSR